MRLYRLIFIEWFTHIHQFPNPTLPVLPLRTGFVRSVTAATLPGAMNASAAVPRSQSEGRAKKNKSRTGSAKDERTQIWPVESWLYNRKLERVEERKLRQLRQDPEKWQYAVMPMFFCMIFWFRCYSLSIGAKSDCVRGEDQLKGSELATCHRIFGKKCSRLRWVGNLAVVKWFCVETWAFWRGTKRISNDIKCAMLYPFPVTEKNM
jgi:hypothetical protein